MKIFDSCARRVTLVEAAEDIASDLAFERYLENLARRPVEERTVWDEILHQYNSMINKKEPVKI